MIPWKLRLFSFRVIFYLRVFVDVLFHRIFPTGPGPHRDNGSFKYSRRSGDEGAECTSDVAIDWSYWVQCKPEKCEGDCTAIAPDADEVRDAMTPELNHLLECECKEWPPGPVPGPGGAHPGGLNPGEPKPRRAGSRVFRLSMPVVPGEPLPEVDCRLDGQFRFTWSVACQSDACESPSSCMVAVNELVLERYIARPVRPLFRCQC